MATRSSILAWKIPWTEKPGRLQSMGLQRLEHDRACTHTHTFCVKFICIQIYFTLSVQYYVSKSSQKFYEVGKLLPILCIRKLRLRELENVLKVVLKGLELKSP